jgi:hypothetical protein
VSDDRERLDAQLPAGEPAKPQPRGAIDPRLLPALPPPSSKSWDRRVNPRSWYLLGCSAGVVVLVVVIVAGYLGLRRTVWRTFDEMGEAVERSVVVDVPKSERVRLERNLARFREQVESSPNPYPAIGRFVSLAREVVADWAVDRAEVERLNAFLRDELGGLGGTVEQP